MKSAARVSDKDRFDKFVVALVRSSKSGLCAAISVAESRRTSYNFGHAMPSDSSPPSKPQAKSARKDRLGEALRANLQKRKAQSRARRAGEADQRPPGLAPDRPTTDRPR